eukprot:TRINITY_DN84686_c0_g1_i1.p1 TRINITY_DN84686_c0_g1~~TRINITY_DN84686_c0_g1_i1.p1  ORF type:complete len:134 (-),score=42.07 TRINITY_DN84686_c0_g1_i1:247-648(-)
MARALIIKVISFGLLATSIHRRAIYVMGIDADADLEDDADDAVAEEEGEWGEDMELEEGVEAGEIKDRPIIPCESEKDCYEACSKHANERFCSEAQKRNALTCNYERRHGTSLCDINQHHTDDMLKIFRNTDL